METERLSEDNVENFGEFIPADIGENIGRYFYNGLIVKDRDIPVAGMIWELKNTMSEKSDIVSSIVWLKADNEEAFTLLFHDYDELISEAGVARSVITLPARTGKFEKQALKNIGFNVKLDEGDTIVSTLAEITDIGFLSKIKPGDDIKPLRSATQRGFNLAMRRMIKAGHTGLCEDIAYLPRLYFENDVSCYYEDDGVISGLFLCHLTASDMLKVVLMAAIGKDYVKILPQMIAQAVSSANEKYDPQTQVVIDRHNYASLALGEKFFPRGFGMPVYVGSRDEKR